MPFVQISDQLHAAVAYLGVTGERWLERLPELVASLEADWAITCSRTLTGGNFAYVAEAVTDDGQPAVLRVALATEGPATFRQELRAYQEVQGDPYASLINYDEARQSLLLEQLGRPIGELGWRTERQISVIASTVARGWRPVDGDEFESGASKAKSMADFIGTTWRKLDRPCSEQAVERAIEYAFERARLLDGDQPVLVHGDPHPWNVLEAQTPGPGTGAEANFRLIDPAGLASEPAHDLGVILRGWNEELLATDAASLAFERCEFVARQTGVDRESIWQWSYIQRVSTGLTGLELGNADNARPYLDVADRLAGVTTPWD